MKTTRVRTRKQNFGPYPYSSCARFHLFVHAVLVAFIMMPERLHALCEGSSSSTRRARPRVSPRGRTNYANPGYKQNLI